MYQFLRENKHRMDKQYTLVYLILELKLPVWVVDEIWNRMDLSWPMYFAFYTKLKLKLAEFLPSRGFNAFVFPTKICYMGPAFCSQISVEEVLTKKNIKSPILLICPTGGISAVFCLKIKRSSKSYLICGHGREFEWIEMDRFLSFLVKIAFEEQDFNRRENHAKRTRLG